MIDYVGEFNDSYERINALGTTGDSFYGRFYENFTGRSEEIARMLAGTDMKQQHRLLRKSLLTLLHFYVHKKNTPDLERIAQRHVDLHVSVEMFDVWLETLTQTLRELDPQFSEEVELSWRIVLGPGMEFMKSRCERAAAGV